MKESERFLLVEPSSCEGVAYIQRYRFSDHKNVYLSTFHTLHLMKHKIAIF